MVGIYKITSPTGKSYIGQALDVEKRWASYKRGDIKFQTRLKRSFFKHGAEAHTFEVLVECLPNELNNYERYYQDLYEATSEKGLNCRLQQGNGKSGALSEEVKQKIGEGNRGKLTGKKRTKECIEKRLATRIKNGANERVSKLYANRTLTAEQKQQISKSLKGVIRTPETKKKISESKYRPIIHVESGNTYESHRAAAKAFNVQPNAITRRVAKGIFKYI